jgi:hypothetical protein
VHGYGHLPSVMGEPSQPIALICFQPPSSCEPPLFEGNLAPFAKFLFLGAKLPWWIIVCPPATSARWWCHPWRAWRAGSAQTRAAQGRAPLEHAYGRTAYCRQGKLCSFLPLVTTRVSVCPFWDKSKERERRFQLCKLQGFPACYGDW